MNIDNRRQLEQALKAGHKVRNIRYDKTEWLQLVDDCIIDESDIRRGPLSSHWWNTHIHALPMRWHVVEDTEKIIHKQSHSIRIFGGEKFCTALKSSLSEVEREQLQQDVRTNKPFIAEKIIHNFVFEPKKKHKPKGHQSPYKFHR